MLFSIIFVMIIYLLLNYIFLFATPINDMVGKVEIDILVGVAIFVKLVQLLLALVFQYCFYQPSVAMFSLTKNNQGYGG